MTNESLVLSSLLDAEGSKLGQTRTATQLEEIGIELDVQARAAHELHEGISEVLVTTIGERRIRPYLRQLVNKGAFVFEDGFFSDEAMADAKLRKQELEFWFEDPFEALVELLDNIFAVGLLARILQVQKKRPGTTPKKFRLLCIHFPVFAAYGEFHMAGGAVLMPQIGHELFLKATDLGALDDHGHMQIPTWYEPALSGLHSMGVRYSEGLPRDTIIDSPVIYGLDLDDDELIVGPEMLLPNADDILASLFVSSTRIENLLGAYAVAYDHFAEIITTLRSIGSRSVHVS